MRSSYVLALFAIGGCHAAAPILSDAPGLPDAPTLSDAPFFGCAPPTGTGTTHGSVMTAQTWTAADSPHDLPFDTGIYAALTIEPCAVIRIGGNKTITINPGGSIIAQGLSARRITFERLDPSTAWASIRALGGDLSLVHADVNGGGAPQATVPVYAGAIQMQRTGTTGTLHVDDVAIEDSASQGVYIDGNTGFDATSQDLRVHGAASFPIHAYANVIGSVPSGTYTGNARDEIAIAGAGGAVTSDQTLHARGVPYHVGTGADGGRLDVNAASGTATLTIEPGVTIRFPAGGTLNVDPAVGIAPARGALIAIGTASQPIVFTSDATTPAAGDWLGLGFGELVAPASALQHVRVEYAGGAGTGSNSCPYPGRVGQNDAAIRIFGTAGPATQFVTDTEIVASARDGIDRGWRDDVATDFLATNTFGVAGCKESVPRSLNGVCPSNPVCP